MLFPLTFNLQLSYIQLRQMAAINISPYKNILQHIISFYAEIVNTLNEKSTNLFPENIIRRAYLLMLKYSSWFTERLSPRYSSGPKRVLKQDFGCLLGHFQSTHQYIPVRQTKLGVDSVGFTHAFVKHGLKKKVNSTPH